MHCCLHLRGSLFLSGGAYGQEQGHCIITRVLFQGLLHCTDEAQQGRNSTTAVCSCRIISNDYIYVYYLCYEAASLSLSFQSSSLHTFLSLCDLINPTVLL